MMVDATTDFLGAGGGESRPDEGRVQGELYLRFVLNSGAEFALPAMGVQEVVGVSPERISAVPNVPPTVMGAYNWRGQVIWIGDLGMFLGLPPLNTNRPELSVIVVSEQGVACGLAIDRVVGAEFLDPRQLRPPLSGENPAQGPSLVQGEWSLPDGAVVQLLAPKALVDPQVWSAAV